MKIITNDLDKQLGFNVDHLSDSETIYKYIAFDGIVDILKNNRIKFTRISSWPDYYECAYFRTIDIIYEDGSIKPTTYNYQKYFGSSWTLHKDSDALWRIYSEKSDGVLISTNLYAVNNFIKNGIAGSTIYYGLLTGNPANDIDMAWSRMDPHLEEKHLSREEKDCAHLLLKHFAYSHEREVRLIVESDQSNNSLYFKVDPTQFIHSITLDPRMCDSKCEMYTDYLIKLGYKNEIKQSKLYDVNLSDLSRTEIYRAKKNSTKNEK